MSVDATLTGVLQHQMPEKMGWALLHFVWQGLVAGGVLWFVLVVLRRSSADLRYWIACLGLGLTALLPVVTILVLPDRPDAVVRSLPLHEVNHSDSEVTLSRIADEPVIDTSVAKDTTRPSDVLPVKDLATSSAMQATSLPGVRMSERTERWLRPWLPSVTLVWLIGVIALSIRLFINWHCVQRLKVVGTRPVGASLDQLLQRLTERLQIRPIVQLLESTLVEVPTVIGWLKPVILLPIASIQGLTVSQLEAILSHELAHIRRADFAINMLQSLIEILLFYHPVVWWISSRIRQERENCCDDLATSISGDAAGYVAALVRMEELRSAPREVAFAARGGDLLSRVRRLLVAPVPDRVAPWWLTGVVALLVIGCVICFSTVSRSQANEAKKDQSESDIDQKAAHTNDGHDKPPTESLTPTQIADRIVETFKRFESIEYAASTKETRNTVAYGTSKEPILVQGTGRIRYRSDGTRWYVAKSSFSFNHGSKETYPTEMQAAFNGSVHSHLDKQTLTFGEHDLTEQLLKPSGHFWRAGISTEWLLAALRRPEAKIDGETTVDGARCHRVLLNWKPAWDKEHHSFEILICPEQNWLIRRVVIKRGQELMAEWIVRKTVSTASGLWYPAEFQITRPESDDTPKYSVVVTEFRERRDFSDQDFSIPFRIGQSIVDYGQGFAWHLDPWWNDLAPWLRNTLSWPQPDLQLLRELRSINDPQIEGRPAPDLRPGDWLTEVAPPEWNRPERKATVVYFFGGGLINPTPRQLKALDQLYRTYRDGGLEIIGITPANVDRKTVLQTVKELNLAIPVFIDSKATEADTQFDARGAEHGATFAAFRQRAYTGTVLIDDDGKVVLIDPNALNDDRRLSRLEQLIRDILQKTNGTADPPSLRQTTVQRMSLVLRGKAAEPSEVQAVLNDPTLVWRQNVEQKIAASMAPADIELFKAKGWTRQVLLKNLNDEPDRLSLAASIRLEEEWKRRAAAANGTGMVTGIIQVKGTTPPENQKTTITIDPRFRLLSSNNVYGFEVLEDRSRKQTVEANSKGDFEFKQLPKGTYELTISSAGRARTTRQVDLINNDSRASVTVDLSQGDSIKGRVVDASGKAIPIARVRPQHRHVPSDLPHVHTTANLPRKEATTDQNGAFVFESLFDGDYVFEVSADGFEQLKTERIPAGTENAKIVLTSINQTGREKKTGKTIAGQVVDRKSRSPIANAEVGLQIWDDGPSTSRNRGPIVAMTTTDGEGHYELTVPSDTKDGAEFAVWASKAGYQLTRENIVQWIRDPSENPSILLVATPGCMIQVRDDAGRPVPQVKVTIEGQTLPESISFSIPDNWHDRLVGTTDVDGRVRIPQVVPEAVTNVRLLAPDSDAELVLLGDFFLNHRPQRKAPNFEWMLPRTGTIEGQINVDGGTLPENLVLQVATETALPKPAPRDAHGKFVLTAFTRILGPAENRFDVGVHGVAKVQVDANGKFKVQSIPAGRVTIKPFLAANQPLKADLRQQMVVTARETTAIEIPVNKGVRVRGAITQSDTGRGHAGVDLQAIYGQAIRDPGFSDEMIDLTTDQDGRFEFWAPPGPVVLVISTWHKDYSSVEWWSDRIRGRGSNFNIPDASEFELDPIVFVPTATVSGRLVDTAGKPLEGWSIYGYPEIPGKPQELVSSCLSANSFEGNGKFSGRYPSTLPPVVWKATHEKWRTPYESIDQKFAARVISKDPLVLEVDTRRSRIGRE